MSLKDLKNTLKACTASSSSLSASSFSQVRSEEEAQEQVKRKPPKTSLKQQLKSLGEIATDLHVNGGDYTLFDTQNECPQKDNCGEQSPKINNEEDDEGYECFREERESGDVVFVQPFTEGPFEPLILGECPNTGLITQVPASINCRLLDHQREGVKFLYNLYKHNHGGVLGDDMGLGKTIQTIAFVAAVLQKDVEFENDFQTRTSEKAFGHKQTKKLVLIICPTSVLQNWENEFNEWGTFSVAIYHGVNKELVLRKIESGLIEIVLTSFDTFRIHGESLCYVDWEVVIIDEAHRLKSDRSQLYKACQKIKTRKCFGLTGTIMQNKIMDLFNVFDLVSPGCLGSREHFREFYDEPLKQGQRISAPERVVQIAEERKRDLLQVLRRCLLRRTKEETIGHLMRGKEDNVVFCAMSPLQKRVYKRLLESPDFKSLILKDLPCSCGSNLTRVECCHKTVPDGIIWSYLHRENPDGCESCPFCLVLPCLVKLQQVSNHLELIKPNPKDEPEKQKKDEALACSVFGKDLELVGGVVQDESFMGLSDVQHCGKMRALEKLMASWISHGDKVLLFSYSVRMLDILEKFLIRKGYCFSRLDGSTPMSNRQSLVDNFNQSPSKQVFLISTRAGGLGLNLISANRVVIFDPNWNPAQDLQAQDRSFRYGQRRHVTVFRLLAAGSLEELVYTRQIYKQQLFNIAVSGNLEKRYFEGVQDSKDFKGELFGICNLFRDLSNRLFTNEIVEQHEKRLESYGHFNVVRNNVGADKQTQMPPNNREMSEPPGTRSMAEAEYQQVDTPVSFEQGGLTTMKETAYTDLPRITNILTDAGVMYVHRNEDVVNSGAHNQAEDTSVDPLELGTSIEPLSRKRQDSRLAAKGMSQKPNKLKNGSESLEHQSKERKVPATKRSSGRALQKMDKYKQYALLAKFRGMTELEFSKWLLSASSSEMERLLLEYKRCISKEEID